MANRIIRADHVALYISHNAEMSDTNFLLDECPDMECTECSWIMCPHQDEMHFHHDGCPSCSLP
jgi:hypothetical protein